MTEAMSIGELKLSISSETIDSLWVKIRKHRKAGSWDKLIAGGDKPNPMLLADILLCPSTPIGNIKTIINAISLATMDRIFTAAATSKYPNPLLTAVALAPADRLFEILSAFKTKSKENFLSYAKQKHPKTLKSYINIMDERVADKTDAFSYYDKCKLERLIDDSLANPVRIVAPIPVRVKAKPSIITHGFELKKTAEETFRANGGDSDKPGRNKLVV